MHLDIKPCGVKTAWLFVLALFFLSASNAFALDQAEIAYRDALVQKALDAKLQKARTWQVLMHYKSTTFHGYESLVDDPLFFLSENGKKSPEAELVATIKSFFDDVSNDDESPLCRFPARFDWLKRTLDIDTSKLPHAQCAEFEKRMSEINPKSAVLIFPVAYVNSPASMFGHTLLRIDSDRQSKLISHALNYSAFTNEENGLFFAIRGIFGFYKGFYSVLPYYEKIKEYNHVENRDMWEYELAFTETEVRRMLMHLWELKDIYTYYYFFDENCSYNLLFMLENARPEADITGLLPGWIIPADTMRAIRSNNIFVNEPVHRPSKAARIKYIASLTRSADQDRAIDIVFGRLEPAELFKTTSMTDEDRIKTLDIASEYLQYVYSKKEISKAEYSKRFISILGERSKLGQAPDYEIPRPAPPDAGHGTSRVGLYAGYRTDGVYQAIRLRPANHDLIDPDRGYMPGASINFLDGEVRFEDKTKRFYLENVTIVEINSIAPRGRFFKPVSWKVKTGVFREQSAKDRLRTIYGLDAGMGLSYGFGEKGFIYGFFGPNVKLGGVFNKGYAFGAEANIGILAPIAEDWMAQLSISATSFEMGEKHRVYTAQLRQRYTINTENSINLELTRKNFDGFYSTDAVIGWNHFY